MMGIMRVFQSLPYTLPAGLAAFSVVAIFHLLIGRFEPLLIVLTGLLPAVVAAYYAHKLVSQNFTQNDLTKAKPFDILVVLGVVVWVVMNLFFASQHIFTNRDPATYNTAAIWLSNHQNLNIEKPGSLNSLTVPGIETESLGYSTNPSDSTKLHAQGAHLLPALQALVGEVFGMKGMLGINIVFGGMALLAFYGFGRLFMKPQWAALACLTLAASLPMIFMSRDSYTEPLTLAFLFGGLSLLYCAMNERKYWQWWLAGLVIGVSALARIDAYLAFIGIELAAIGLLMIAQKRDRTKLLASVAWLVGGLAIGGYLGWLDIVLLSTSYYQAHYPLIIKELILMLGLVVVGTIAVPLNWRFNILKWLEKTTRKWRGWLLSVLIGGFFVVLASRPLWYIGLQDRAVASSPRTFSEQTINWIIWYIGPILMIAGVVGLIMLVLQLMRKNDKRLLPFIMVLVVSSFLYLLNPNITGDQVWATRRLLPVVTPGFVLLGMLVFEYMYQKNKTKWRKHTIDLKMTATVLATLSVASPLFISYPFVVSKLYVPELDQTQTICSKLPKDSTVVWVGEARFFATQPTRAICGNDSLGLNLPMSSAASQSLLQNLAQKGKDADKQIIIGLYPDDAKNLGYAESIGALTVSKITYNEIEHTYIRFPRNLIELDRTILLGKLLPDGTIVPIDKVHNNM